jgi:GNAT superfamily N-acetyltransferase
VTTTRPDLLSVDPHRREPRTRTARIQRHQGDRRELRFLFELAEDSGSQLDAYLHLGQVLVARRDDQIVGHLQYVPTAHPEQVELKNMAVSTPHQGQGIGRALVESLVERLAAVATTILVATAAADIDNLRFYQRRGFRFRSVERDAFTAATGYPGKIHIDGIELRDRVWLDLTLPYPGPA